jgi:hypothetical protein
MILRRAPVRKISSGVFGHAFCSKLNDSRNLLVIQNPYAAIGNRLKGPPMLWTSLRLDLGNTAPLIGLALLVLVSSVA